MRPYLLPLTTVLPKRLFIHTRTLCVLRLLLWGAYHIVNESLTIYESHASYRVKVILVAMGMFKSNIGEGRSHTLPESSVYKTLEAEFHAPHRAIFPSTVLSLRLNPPLTDLFLVIRTSMGARIRRSTNCGRNGESHASCMALDWVHVLERMVCEYVLLEDSLCEYLRVHIFVVSDFLTLLTGFSYVEGLRSDPAGRETAKEGQGCLNLYITISSPSFAVWAICLMSLHCHAQYVQVKLVSPESRIESTEDHLD